jgi:hypothetical protein
MPIGETARRNYVRTVRRTVHLSGSVSAGKFLVPGSRAGQGLAKASAPGVARRLLRKRWRARSGIRARPCPFGRQRVSEPGRAPSAR